MNCTVWAPSTMEMQSDLEVILEFLEEYHKQNSEVNGVAMGERCVPVEEPNWTSHEPPVIKSATQSILTQDAPAMLRQSTTETLSECGSLPKFTSKRQSTKHPTAAARSGRRVRLFHFLFEMLENPNMAHCLSWVPAAAGVFRFSSKNKDQVAALWGKTKGNKRPMTYQKMSRALRNYARSGEIFKVKKKLTYQFSIDTLMSLQKCRRTDL
ncbi:DNA-binding protein Ets97D isoform 2-T2 [Pholidichthys leucotaenia]